MAPGVTVAYQNSSFVSSSGERIFSALTLLTDSFYKNIVLYMTQFWVSFLVKPFNGPALLTGLLVLLLQQLLWPNSLRVMDTIFLQCHLHRPPPTGHWCIRSICLCADFGQVSAAVHPRPEERVFHKNTILALGWQRVLSQYREL